MSIKTIFLDRDGVINKDTNYLYKIKDFEFIKGVFTACKHLQNLDYKFKGGLITGKPKLAKRGF